MGDVQAGGIECQPYRIGLGNRPKEMSRKI